MKAFIMLLAVVPALAFAKAEKIDWKPCKKELVEFCTTAASDLEKHECLEELPKGKGSKACLDFNKGLEAKLGHKHDDGHKHGAEDKKEQKKKDEHKKGDGHEH